MNRRISIHTESWPLLAPFGITGKVWTEFTPVICEIEQDGCMGRGEGHGVYYLKETADRMLAQIESVLKQLESGVDRQALQKLLPPGGARNAVDCAMWDLESKLNGASAWKTAGTNPGPVETVFTIGLEPEPQTMAEKAAAASNQGLLKIKLDGDRPVERIEAIRKARPDARLVVDANQGWNFAQLKEVAPAMKSLGVLMLEQPLPRGGDAELEGYQSELPLCADESCQHRGELDDAQRRYQMVNIKLDKAGGLTEGLLLAQDARKRGLGLMVGTMGGTSLAMAPSHVVAQLCEFVDIDGPLLLKNDRVPGLNYNADGVAVPKGDFWGLPKA